MPSRPASHGPKDRKCIAITLRYFKKCCLVHSHRRSHLIVDAERVLISFFFAPQSGRMLEGIPESV